MTQKTHPVHPGKILFEQAMTPLGVSRNKLARDIDVPVGRISDIVSGKRGITPDTALRLSKYFGTTPELWLRLQSDYDLSVARNTVWAEIEPRVRAFQPPNGAPAVQFAEPAPPVAVSPPPEAAPMAPPEVADDVDDLPEVADEVEVDVEVVGQPEETYLAEPDSDVDIPLPGGDEPFIEDALAPWPVDDAEDEGDSLEIPDPEDSLFPIDRRS